MNTADTMSSSALFDPLTTSGISNSDKDVERSGLASIEESAGWHRKVKSKLASWDPENEEQWENGFGGHIATRNLLISIPNISVAFAVWVIWTIVSKSILEVHKADPTLYAFEDWGSPQDDEYKRLVSLLPSVAGLSGATLRVSNTFMTHIVGGKIPNAQNSILLMLPTIMIAWALNSTDTSFSVLLLAAWLTGVGGGAFSSSNNNISTLFPKSQQGYALGFNAGIGNFGVSLTQLFVPLCIGTSFGNQPLAPDLEVWPNHAGWVWWPVALLAAIGAYIWMSDLPEHGNHNGNDELWNTIYFYCMHIQGLLGGALGVLFLIATRNTSFFHISEEVQIAHKFLAVLLTCVVEHLILWYVSPPVVREGVRKQGEMFRDKHTWIMTFIYIMSFSCFIGYAAVFPKLIDFAYGKSQEWGCTDQHGVFTVGGAEDDCLDYGGTWTKEAIDNPDAPNPFSYAWIGAGVGSLIRPVGGMAADAWGGANCTMVLTLWLAAVSMWLGSLLKKTISLDHPEDTFALFVFLSLNVFLSAGGINGTSFRTIGVLYDTKLAGPVLGWSSAMGSYGAYIFPELFDIAIESNSPEKTFYGLASYYLVCAGLNWWYYVRPGAERRGV
ncbi:Inherit from proNOG: Nitrate nitrite [Seminavis robusta]|uniref:Inherit from proNOG: Nitrate nitrite n=1 Tax=Seminavis robusta TaxID=568900 RepID=A0A9N8E1H1_9STRA|nr:Inherit from proNOG: Nitrate nitrite [Seminavis robusta]|eukprot:Sro553_g165410.1 Inherit from proNOG: Nitrate nitrite (611) ;mRNA; f:57069-59006